MNIAERIKSINAELGKNVKLIAVSKKQELSKIMEAYNSGIRDFGENYVQELTEKQDKLPKDIKWHMIGHLQSNKVKYIATFIDTIHSVDSFKLLNEINKEAKKNNRKINCLLQLHVAKEETKTGFDQTEFKALLETDRLKEFDFVNIIGIMGMSTFTDNMNQIENEFETLHQSLISLQNRFPEFNATELSMGMSSDYQTAIKKGSTMVRIGSTIFGTRL